jgi:hypothetical protein
MHIEEPVRALLDAINDYLKAEQGVPGPPITRIALTVGGVQILVTRAVETVEAFATAARLPPPHGWRELKAVGDVYCHLVGKWPQEQGRPVTWMGLLRAAGMGRGAARRTNTVSPASFCSQYAAWCAFVTTARFTKKIGC